MINLKDAARMGRWQWAVCLLLLTATMINYMDRQTLSSLANRIKDQFQLSNEQYGNLELAFSISFAVGSLVWGALADIVHVRYLYPFVLVAWSLTGFATGLSSGYESLFYCRAVLGFFESGHWPCAGGYALHLDQCAAPLCEQYFAERCIGRRDHHAANHLTHGARGGGWRVDAARCMATTVSSDWCGGAVVGLCLVSGRQARVHCAVEFDGAAEGRPVLRERNAGPGREPL